MFERIGGKVAAEGGEDAVADLDKGDAAIGGIDAAIASSSFTKEDIELAGDLDAGEAAADDDEVQGFAAAFGIVQSIGEFEHGNGAIAETDGITHVLDFKGILTQTGNGRHARHGAERDDEMVVGEDSRLLVADQSVCDGAGGGINRGDIGHLKLGAAEEIANGNDDVAGLETARAGFDEERVEDEVVVAIEEENVSIGLSESALKMLGAICTGKAAAEDDDALGHSDASSSVGRVRRFAGTYTGSGGDAREIMAMSSTDHIVIRRGVAYAMFIYDIGLGVRLDEAEGLLAASTSRQVLPHRRRTPRHFEFQPAPLRVSGSSEGLTIGSGQVVSALDCVVYDFGAVAVVYEIPVNGAIEVLLEMGDALYECSVLLKDSERRVGELMERVRPAVNKPNRSAFVEDYVVYQLEEVVDGEGRAVRPADVVTRHAGLLAGVLRAERATLSQQEVDDALSSRMAYTDDDLVIIDWNAAMVFDRDAEDTRTVLEYANVELLEMRHLDHRLDLLLNESHKTISENPWKRIFLFRSQTGAMRYLAELRIDSAVMFEEVNNALKLLGDQYLARVYRLAAQRLHIGDWDGSILRKLDTAESMYDKMSDYQSARRIEVLEWIIILLIAWEVVWAFLR